MKANCDYCHKPMEITSSRKYKQKHIYCSRRCYEKHKHELALIEVKCEWCGKIFKKRKSQIKKKEAFCSRFCSGKYNGIKLRRINDTKSTLPIRKQRVNIICKNCGEKSNILLIAKRYKKTELCQKCAYELCKKKRLKNLKKAIVVKRYKKKCANCGKILMLTENQIKNGRIVCGRKCQTELSKNREEFICLICGKKFIRPVSAKSKYCSRKCNGIAFKNYLKEHPEIQRVAAQARIGLPISQERRLKNKIATLNLWKNDEFVYKVFKGLLFGKNHKLNELDKKVIETHILIYKIRRSLNDKKYQ